MVRSSPSRFVLERCPEELRGGCATSLGQVAEVGLGEGLFLRHWASSVGVLGLRGRRMRLANDWRLWIVARGGCVQLVCTADGL